MTSRIRIGVALAFGLCASSFANMLVYQPSLGTLPQAQGWTFDGNFSAPMSVSGGVLTYGTTSTPNTTYWGHQPTDTINFATDTASISADIRLNGTDFGNISGFRRGGFSLYLEDDFGNYIIADLGDNNISLGNDNTRLNDPVASFDLHTDFHVVRLEAGPTGGRLYVDGVLQLSLALGGSAGGGAVGSWGEMSILTRSVSTEVRSVQYIPAPGSALLSLGGIALVGTRRRR